MPACPDRRWAGDGDMVIRVNFLITGSARLPLLCAFDGCPAKKETRGGITEEF